MTRTPTSKLSAHAPSVCLPSLAGTHDSNGCGACLMTEVHVSMRRVGVAAIRRLVILGQPLAKQQWLQEKMALTV